MTKRPNPGRKYTVREVRSVARPVGVCELLLGSIRLHPEIEPGSVDFAVGREHCFDVDGWFYGPDGPWASVNYRTGRIELLRCFEPPCHIVYNYFVPKSAINSAPSSWTC